MAYRPFSFLRPRNEDDEMISPYRKILFDSLPASSDTSLPNPKQDLTSLYGSISGLEDTPELVAYKQHLLNAPTAEQHKPGKMGRLAAALAGVSEGYFGGAARGVSAAQGVIQSPYRRARQEWEEKGQGLGQLANISRQTMLDRGNFLKSMEQARLAAQKFELDAKNIQDQMASRAVSRAEGIARTRKLEEETKLSGYEKIQDKSTGVAYMIHPVTKHKIELGRFDESAPEQRAASARTNWDLFSKQEGLRQQNRLALEDVQLNNTKAMEGVRQEDRKELAKYQHELNKNRDAARIGSASGRIAQNKQAALSVIDSDPHLYQKMGITIDNGNIVANPDDLNLSSPEKVAKYVALMNTLYAGIPGASKLTMPKGFDEYGNKKTTSKYDIQR